MKSKTHQLSQLNDSSKDEALVSMEKLAAKVRLQKLEEHNVGLSQTIDKLLEELKKKEEEIDHLKHMLGRNLPIVGQISPLLMTDEEAIAEKQLQRLKEQSLVRDLTLDEAKRLDIYVKIKHSKNNTPKTLEANNGLPKNLQKPELLHIASKKIVETEE